MSKYNSEATKEFNARLNELVPIIEKIAIEKLNVEGDLNMNVEVRDTLLDNGNKIVYVLKSTVKEDGSQNIDLTVSIETVEKDVLKLRHKRGFLVEEIEGPQLTLHPTNVPYPKGKGRELSII